MNAAPLAGQIPGQIPGQIAAVFRRSVLCGSVACATLCLAVLSACAPLLGAQSAPVNYYVLSATGRPAAAPIAEGGPVYAVAPVRVPDYLQQTALVTRSGDNQIRVAANDQWAAPLRDGIGGVLVENLSAMIPAERVVQMPAPPAIPIDYTVFVEIIRFERQPDASVELLARWSVFGDGGRDLLAIRTSSYRTPDVAADFTPIVGAMSGLLGELSRDIADVLRTAPTPTTRRPAA